MMDNKEALRESNVASVRPKWLGKSSKALTVRGYVHVAVSPSRLG